MNLTPAVLADPAAPLVLKITARPLIAAAPSDLAVMLAFSKGTFVPLSGGDVRITVGVTQGVTIPGSSALQPPQKTTKTKTAVNPAESVMPRDPRIIRENCAHLLEAVVRFVFGVFINSSVNSKRMDKFFCE
jgi:hypothetical protein